MDNSIVLKSLKLSKSNEQLQKLKNEDKIKPK